MNNTVRNDLCVPSIRNGHKHPSRTSISNTYNHNKFRIYRFPWHFRNQLDYLYIQPCRMHVRKIPRHVLLLEILLVHQQEPVLV